MSFHKLYKIPIFAVLFLVTVMPAYGLDTPGLKNTIPIETGGYDFDVELVANFDLQNHEFSEDEKRLTLFIESNLEDNLAEIIIPVNLIGGNFTFYLNDEQIDAKYSSASEITFMTVQFEGIGSHRLDIIGTTYLPEFADIATAILGLSVMSVILLKAGRLKKLFVN